MFDSYTDRPRDTRGVMRMTILLLLALLAQTMHVRAQHNDRPNYQLLWRIDGPGMQAPSYLFGTMHLTDNRVFEFSDSVLTALRGTRSFAMEVDMDSVMAYMLSPGGPLLDTVNHMRRLLNADEYRYVDSLVKEKTGAPLDKLSLKRLWFIEKLLINEAEELSKNAGPEKKPENIFLDAWLHQKATGLSKPVHSLERLQNQMGMLSADATEVQKEVFLWGIGYKGHDDAGDDGQDSRVDRLGQRVAYLDALVNLYYKGDLAEITKVLSDMESSGEDLRLESRNREMTGNLAALIGKGSVFAAVGVAHLPGKTGMLAMLREKGFSVSPVNASFTGVTKRERRQLDSLKGYSLNRIADGYSVALPGNPVSYPLPNMNRHMYIGGNNDEVGFAFCIDIPQLASDKRELVNTMINNMAAQGNAELQKVYPITYRNMPGTEAMLLQKNLPFYIRVFIRNNRAFLFMYNGGGKDSSGRKDFFQSVRFYDIVRPMAVYDTVFRPQLGFSAILPSDASLMAIGRDTERPEEVYSALDNANSISYILRAVKIKQGYYNTSDKDLLTNLRALAMMQDSTMQLTDSTFTTINGLPRYQLTFRHGNGYTSRLHFVPRGNLAYSMFCTYDGARTDSSYWKRFLGSLRVLPLQAKAPAVPFTPADGSFTVTGPGAFTGGDEEDEDGYRPKLVDSRFYSAMDSASYSMYIINHSRYSPYYHIEPDSLVKSFIHPNDSTFEEVSTRQYADGSMQVYEAELKGKGNGLHWYRKAVVAGRTVYSISAILPEELASTGHGKQFLASFRPGSKELADTSRLQQNKIHMLLGDLQSTDTAVFKRASAYLYHLNPDSADIAPVLSALDKPFPADTGEVNAKVQLLRRLDGKAGNDAVKAAEKLFAATPGTGKRKQILAFLSGLATDSAIRVFLRLAPELPEEPGMDWGIFDYNFKRDSLYTQYMPQMVATAARSASFLQSFVALTYSDSLWLSPQFGRYELESLVPGVERMFKRKLQEWKSRRNDEDSSWMWENSLQITGHVLALPGMPPALEGSFRELLADTVMTLRALGAQGLISRGIKVNDKTLKSILQDFHCSYSFITAINGQKQVSHIRHLLSQELLGRSYVAYYLVDEYEVDDIQQVSRVKVQHGKEAAWLVLYRYKIDGEEEWGYVLNGPHPADAAKLNFEPDLFRWIGKDIAIDKTKLNAEAQKAYKNYLEEPEESTE